MIDARNFAPPAFRTDQPHFAFGLDAQQVAAELRRFADDIDAGKIAVQSAQTGGVAKQEDFVVHGLFIEFARKTEGT